MNDRESEKRSTKIRTFQLDPSIDHDASKYPHLS